jgi:acyl carrier protein
MEQQSFLRLLDELFELDQGTITPSDVLQDIPGWSSLTFVGLIAMVDEECGVTLAPAAVLKCRTVCDLYALANPDAAGKKAA